MTDPKRDRVEELLADKALWGIDADAQAELHNLLDELGQAEEQALEPWTETAGIATEALLGDREEAMPDSLMRMLQTDAVRYHLDHHDKTLEDLSVPAGSRPSPAPTSTWTSRNSLGWLVAAAALLALVLRIFDAPAEEVEPSVLVARAELEATATDLLAMEWAEGPSDLRGAPRGDVIWSDAEQSGYMRFRGLRPNDPNVNQYQLWIFDKERDVAKPVDGGVFDMPAGDDEIVIPIDAKLAVKEAFGFAVTVEEPGGVALSDRDHIVVLAGL